MEREILFRGINFQREWVYGDLFHSYANDDIAIAYYREGSKTPTFDAIFPESFGQYTGLKDKNRNKIFEGDILTGRNCRFVVKYDERQAEFVAVNSTLPNGFGLPMSQTWIDETNKIICGNIHDNPELIK